MNIKFSPKLFYPVLIILLIAALIIFTSKEKKSNNEQVEPKQTAQEIPQDEAHSNLKENSETTPSKSNVAENIKHELEELRKKTIDNPSDTAAMKQLADFLLASHNPNEAFQYYQNILKVNSKRIDVMFAIAVIHHQNGELDKAEEVTNQILKISKNNSQAIYNLGAIAATKGEIEKAKKIWNDLIKKFPNSADAKLAKQSLQRL